MYSRTNVRGTLEPTYIFVFDPKNEVIDLKMAVFKGVVSLNIRRLAQPDPALVDHDAAAEI